MANARRERSAAIPMGRAAVGTVIKTCVAPASVAVLTSTERMESVPSVARDDGCGACETCEQGVCTPASDCCIEANAACSVDGVRCCDDLLCCELEGGAICAECCRDDDCGRDGRCDRGVCNYPHGDCGDDGHCPDGTCCCADGSCSGKCCPPTPPTPSPSSPSDGVVTSLPVTGSGQPSESDELAGVAALGAAAAAIVAAKRLRESSPPASDEERTFS